MDVFYERNELGFLILKRRGVSVSAELIEKLMEEIDEEDFNRALKLAGKAST